MSDAGAEVASQPPPIEPKVDLEKKQLAEEVAALKSEVKKWKGEAEDAKALAGQAHGDSQSVAETKAKDLAKKNRELNLKVQKLQDELLRPKAAGALGSPEAGPLTYSMKKAQAKADEEAQAEIKKYKGLYDTGAKRIARFQQEVECQKIALERQEKQKKEVQGKVALLQDQLDSIQTRSQSPDVDPEGKPRTAGAPRATQHRTDEDRSGLAWKVRHSEAAAELKSTREELAEVRMVAEGALARREVLEGQIKRTREQVKQLLAKSDDDDTLIRTLHCRLTAQADSSGSASDAIVQQAEELRRKCAQQQTQISAQEKIINALNSSENPGTTQGAPNEQSGSVTGSEQHGGGRESELARGPSTAAGQ